jgi:hypothetical protein
MNWLLSLTSWSLPTGKINPPFPTKGQVILRAILQVKVGHFSHSNSIRIKNGKVAHKYNDKVRQKVRSIEWMAKVKGV